MVGLNEELQNSIKQQKTSHQTEVNRLNREIFELKEALSDAQNEAEKANVRFINLIFSSGRQAFAQIQR